MTDQLQLVNVTPEDRERDLTPRQRFALQIVRDAGWDAIDADAVGAAWCAQRGRHSVDTRCQHDGHNGNQVLRRLRELKYVKYRRGTDTIPSGWIALNENGNPPAKPSRLRDGLDDLIAAGF